MKKKLQLLFLALIVSVQVNSQTGAALNFDGIDDYVINTTPTIPSMSAFTFETWINVNNTSNGKLFSSNEMEVAVAGGQINFYCPAFSANNISIIPTGVWKHIAITYDGAKLKFFIDGVLDNMVAATGSIGANTGYKIGKHVSVGCCQLEGSLDEFRIWNTTRTQCEIISYMDCEIPTSTSGLVANYHFNQGVANANNSFETTLMDASGNSNTGTLTNFTLNGTASNWIAPGGVVSGYTTTAVCTPGAALSFDGADDYVQLVDPNFGTSDFTIEAWIKPNTTTGSYVISTRSNEFGAAGNWFVVGTNNGKIGLEMADAGLTYAYFETPGTPVTIGAWNHVAVVRSGMQITIYVNGNQEASYTDSGVRNFSTNSMRLSGWPEVGVAFFDGSMDEVRFWNIARTRCGIISNMNCEIPSSAIGLVDNYHFNQGIASANNNVENMIIDASGNSNTGTLTNFTLNGATSNWISPGGVVSGYTTTTVCTPAAALSFDGADDYIDLGNVLPAGSSYTKEMWVYANNTGCNNLLSSGDDPFYLSGGSLAAGNGGNYNYVQDPTPFPVNIWTHACVTYDAPTTTMKLYVNGILVSSGSSASAYSGIPTMYVGRHTGGCYFDGTLDELRIWNVARTQCEINTYMNCEIPNSTTGLAVNYHFNQGITGANNSFDVTAMDVSGNSNNQPLSNFALIGGTSNWVSPGGVVTGYTTTLAPPTVTVNSGSICSGTSFTMIPSGAVTYIYSNGSDVTTPSANDTYTVTGTAANTCTNTTVSSVTVNTLPTVSVNSGAICSGTSFTMIPSGASTYTYSSGSAIVTPTANASYNVTGTSAQGCVSTNTAVSSVTVNALPVLIATTNNTLLCSGQTATLSVTGATSYTWSTTETTANIAVSPAAQATYTVNGTDVNSCSNTTTVTQDVSLCTGITSITSVNTTFVNVYPNPNNGVFTIKADVDVNLNLTNALGQVLQVILLNDSNQHQMNVEVLSNGIYFIIGQNNNQSIKQKVIVTN